MIPTSVQEAHDMAYPGDIMDFVVQQTKVDFATASATLDAYHGDVVDTIVALACGAGATPHERATDIHLSISIAKSFRHGRVVAILPIFWHCLIT